MYDSFSLILLAATFAVANGLGTKEKINLKTQFKALILSYLVRDKNKALVLQSVSISG